MHGLPLPPIAADSIDRAILFGIFAAGFLFGTFGLLENVRIAALFVPPEIIGRGLAAEVAVNALIIHVKLATRVDLVFVRYISHKDALFRAKI